MTESEPIPGQMTLNLKDNPSYFDSDDLSEPLDVPTFVRHKRQIGEESFSPELLELLKADPRDLLTDQEHARLDEFSREAERARREAVNNRMPLA